MRYEEKCLSLPVLMREQVNDTAFRRHVLVQALILLDFMLSLTLKSKARLADVTNKSVLYGFVLSEEDVRPPCSIFQPSMGNLTIDRPNGRPKCERRSRNIFKKEQEANSIIAW